MELFSSVLENLCFRMLIWLSFCLSPPFLQFVLFFISLIFVKLFEQVKYWWMRGRGWGRVEWVHRACLCGAFNNTQSTRWYGEEGKKICISLQILWNGIRIEWLHFTRTKISYWNWFRLCLYILRFAKTLSRMSIYYYYYVNQSICIIATSIAKMLGNWIMKIVLFSTLSPILRH